MKQTFQTPDAATGKTAKQEKYEKKMAKYLANKARKEQNENERRGADVELKINNILNVVRPTFTNGEMSFITGKTFYINERSAIYVQDVCEQQNSTLFEQGLKLIDSKVYQKRRSYLAKMFGIVLPNIDMNMDDMLAMSCKHNAGRIIALVCDIALHKNKKLANPQAYDKDFNKYVANLFQEYSLDGGFEQYVQLGAGDLAPVPIFMVSPEMYNWASATA